MPKVKISPARAAVLGVKTASIASRKRPHTRNEDGSVKGVKPAADAAKPADDKGAAPKPAKGAASAPAPKKAARKVAAKKADDKAPAAAEKEPAADARELPEATAKADRRDADTMARLTKLPADKRRDARAFIGTDPLSDAFDDSADDAAEPVINGQDAPAALPKPPAQGEVLSSDALELPLRWLEAALEVAATDDVRYYLNTVYLHQLPDLQLRVVATDGCRMLVASIVLQREIPWLQGKGKLLSSVELARVLKYVGKHADSLLLDWDQEQERVQVREGIATFSMTPIGGDFPPYQRLVDASASVFTAEREELSMTQLDSKFVKSATAVAAKLGAKSIIPFLSADVTQPSVFAFSEVPEALLYIAGQKAREVALPPSTARLYGPAAMQATLERLEAQIEKTRANAAKAKHEHFRKQFLNKAERLELRARQLRESLAALPKPESAEVQAPPAAAVH